MFELPRIKICGITDTGDARAAAAAGCDAIGVVEYPHSPRCVAAGRAHEIVDAAGPHVHVVAVMVGASPEHASRWLETSGARAVQLCGAERAPEWRGVEYPVLRRVAVDDDAEDELEAWRDIATAFVLDHPSGPGGTGHAVDLEIAARLSKLAPCLLAGGLDERNVAERIARVRPFGVDASSRLETRPGRKDRARVAAFVKHARAALNEVHR